MAREQGCMDLTALEILRELNRRGVILVVRGEKLGVFPSFRVTPELREKLKQHRPEILKLLKVTTPHNIQPDGRCWVCRGDKWWLSVYGAILCARCHPPVPPSLVEEWLTGDEAWKIIELRGWQ